MLPKRHVEYLIPLDKFYARKAGDEKEADELATGTRKEARSIKQILTALQQVCYDY